MAGETIPPLNKQSKEMAKDKLAWDKKQDTKKNFFVYIKLVPIILTHYLRV